MKQIILFLAIVAQLGIGQLAAQTRISEPYSRTGTEAITPASVDHGWAAEAMGTQLAAAPICEEGETDDPHMSGKWLVLIDKNDEEHWYNMYTFPDDLDYEGWYYLMLTLHVEPWNENVPFFFMVDGVRYGADEDMQVPIYSEAEVNYPNPLYEKDNRFCVPSDYTYLFCIVPNAEGIYMLIARSPNHDHSDSVESVLADQVRPVDGNYYNLMGQPVGTEVPTVPGIYIHQGKKIVVR